MSKIEIYYFSGTGNSLHVAQELQKRIPEANLIPIMSLLHQDVIETKGETVGFVFPLHAFTVPFPVKEFLQKINATSATYMFALATRGGSPCRVFQDMNRMLKRKGKSIDATFFIDMPNNFLLNFDLPTNDQINQLESQMGQQLDSIQNVIGNREKSQIKDPNHNFVLENVVFPLLGKFIHRTHYYDFENRLYADSKCTGCKTCETTCLSGKIKIQDGRPVWQKDVKCTFCFACIHCCPSQAIQVQKTTTPEKGRYVHPAVTAQDIAAQK